MHLQYTHDIFQFFCPQSQRSSNHQTCSLQRPTALAKILGVYRIGYKNSQNNTEKKLDLLVMENLFYGRKMAQVSLSGYYG